MPGFNFKLFFLTTYDLFWLSFEWVPLHSQKNAILEPEMYKLSLTQHQPQACCKKLPAKQQLKVSPSNASSHNFTMIVGTSAGFSSKAITCLFFHAFLSVWSKCLHCFQRTQQRASWRAFSLRRARKGMPSRTTKKVVPLQMMWELPGGNGGPRYTCSYTFFVQCQKVCPTWWVQHPTPSSWSV